MLRHKKPRRPMPDATRGYSTRSLGTCGYCDKPRDMSAAEARCGFVSNHVRPRPCSHGPGCPLPWSVHDWSYEADYEARANPSESTDA